MSASTAAGSPPCVLPALGPRSPRSTTSPSPESKSAKSRSVHRPFRFAAPSRLLSRTRGGAKLARDLINRVRELLGARYDVIRPVGRGGNATLFGAVDKRGQRVAIKVLHPELAVSVAADRFLREIRYAAKLHHPHIAPLLDSGESDYLLWFVMPYVEGETLRQVLRRERMLPIDRAVRVATEVLDALAHAHDHGLAHRDIKPDNIVLSSEGGGAVLVDFGIARAIATSGEDRVTRSGF